KNPVISKTGWPRRNSLCRTTSGSGNTSSISKSRAWPLRRERAFAHCAGGRAASIPNRRPQPSRVRMASDGSPRRGMPKSHRTRGSILNAARTAFARKGFSGVTIRDITDLAPVTRASFYYYFSDKTELFIELGTDTYRQALAIVEGFVELASPPNRAGIEAW